MGEFKEVCEIDGIKGYVYTTQFGYTLYIDGNEEWITPEEHINRCKEIVEKFINIGKEALKKNRYKHVVFMTIADAMTYRPKLIKGITTGEVIAIYKRRPKFLNNC